VTDDNKRRLPIVDGPVRMDLDDGLRFVHVLNMQTKHDLFEASTKLSALVEELVAKGQIDPVALAARRERIQQREQPRQAQQAHVRVADVFDKYALRDLPDIDCASLIPICKARCCKLYFCLSFQDLDEGVIEWDYAIPYYIRKRPDHTCVHQDAGTGGCTVYDKRPGACRSYDCRNDKRIWLDFEKRIPAPVKDELAPNLGHLPLTR
jgi:Fe-S-cluster containining protein